tara:strand:- start:2877 stop:3161 length:285 start_codon:yes stop_codon:yes gene_type:complete
MSENKKKKNKNKNKEPDIQSQNMITFNPNKDIVIKLGKLVNIKSLITNLIDNHSGLHLSSDEVMRYGLFLEEINKYVRDNAIMDNENKFQNESP